MDKLYCICNISIKLFFFLKEEKKSITVLRGTSPKATGDLDSNELTSISMTQLGEYEPGYQIILRNYYSVSIRTI